MSYECIIADGPEKKLNLPLNEGQKHRICRLSSAHTSAWEPSPIRPGAGVATKTPSKQLSDVLHRWQEPFVGAYTLAELRTFTGCSQSAMDRSGPLQQTHDTTVCGASQMVKLA